MLRAAGHDSADRRQEIGCGLRTGGAICACRWLNAIGTPHPRLTPPAPATAKAAPAGGAGSGDAGQVGVPAPAIVVNGVEPPALPSDFEGVAFV
jgi:hypothetical protein